MREETKKLIILSLAGLGLCATVELAIVYYHALFSANATPSICSVNSFIDCDGVARTKESQFFGIPLAYWGMLWYIFVFVMLKVDELKERKFLRFLEVFKNPMDYIAVLGLFSFIVSMILLGISLFEIKKLCIFCAFTYVLNLIIALVAVRPRAEGSFWGALKQSVTDFVYAVQVQKYLIAFCVCVLAGIGILTYTTTTMVFAPHVKTNREFEKLKNAKIEDYLITGNYLGSPDAPIKVDVYSDYDCPVCRYLHIQLYYLAKMYPNVQFVHKNYPLDNSCNKYLQLKGHLNSCMKARYAEAAMEQGMFNDFAARIFDEQPESEQEVLLIAKDLGLDIEQLKKDAMSEKTKKIINDDIDEALKNGLAGTPFMVIGTHKKMGMNSMKDTQKWLELNGARRK